MTNYITTEEWEQEVKKLGFIITTEEKLYVIRYQLCVVAISFRQTMFAFRINIFPFVKLPKTMQEELYNLLDRYARTPLDKREAEKRYRLKLDVSSRIENNWQILAKNVDDGCYHIGSGRGSEKWQTVFTQAEIDAMGDIARGFIKERICEK